MIPFNRADRPTIEQEMFPRVLIVHCRYKFRGGEDIVVENESSLLQRHGVGVSLYELSNESIDDSDLASRLLLGFRTTWNRQAANALRREVERNGAQLVHFHNTFPLLSPAAYYAVKETGAKIVQTLHNYRLICGNAQLLRDLRPCEKCVGGKFFYGAVHRCYRGSLGASSAVALMQHTYHGIGTYRRMVDRYIALTEFAKRKFVTAGLPEERIVVKPNSLVDTPESGEGNGNFVLYVGRLSAEKGVVALLRAWRQVRDVPLKIAGDGPLRDSLRELARDSRAAVEFLGHLDRRRVLDLMGEAKMLILPSEWYEGFPMTIAESYAMGTPVVASDIGSLSEIVEEGNTGRTFQPGNVDQLASVVQSLFGDEVALRSMRRNCRQRYLERYTGEDNARQLIAIYRDVTGT